jgi:hypothetical protein
MVNETPADFPLMYGTRVATVAAKLVGNKNISELAVTAALFTVVVAPAVRVTGPP